MIFGCVANTILMKSGAPMLGMPESMLMNIIVGQVVRKLEIPWRASGVWSTSKLPDLQAGYESIMSSLPLLNALANWLLHGP